jgi:hypothetical protein
MVKKAVELAVSVIGRRTEKLCEVAEKEGRLSPKEVDYTVKELSVFTRDSLFQNLMRLAELAEGSEKTALQNLARTHRTVLLQACERVMEDYPAVSKAVLSLTENLKNDPQVKDFELGYFLGRVRALALLSWSKYEPSGVIPALEKEFLTVSGEIASSYRTGLISALSEKLPASYLPTFTLEVIAKTLTPSPDRDAFFYYKEVLSYAGKELLERSETFKRRKDVLEREYGLPAESLISEPDDGEDLEI